MKTAQRPLLLLPPGLPGASTLLGCDVVNSAAAPGWVVAVSHDGTLSAASIKGDLQTVTGADTRVVRFVGGPLDGRLEQRAALLPMIEVMIFGPPQYLGDSPAGMASAVQHKTGVYRMAFGPGGGPLLSRDGYRCYVWEGERS